ncbi:MAG: hypothetical protein ACC661_03275, partial [Verrucomicrobiales bacterium]
MNRPWPHLPALLLLSAGILCLLAGNLCAQSPQGSPRNDTQPSDLYLKGYLAMRDGVKLDEERNYEAAYRKYLEANAVIDSVGLSYPAWNPHMVSFRRKTLRDMISALEAKAARETGVDLVAAMRQPSSAAAAIGASGYGAHGSLPPPRPGVGIAPGAPPAAPAYPPRLPSPGVGTPGTPPAPAADP